MVSTTKTRTTIAMLIAALSISAIAMPAAAGAMPISQKDRAKAQAVKQQRLDSDCSKLDADTDHWRNIANDTSKSDKERKDAATNVMGNLEFGLAENCAFAGGTGVPR
jgi:Flp pilus assembly protein TadB